MAIVRKTLAELRANPPTIDRAKLDATTEADSLRHMREDEAAAEKKSAEDLLAIADQAAAHLKRPYTDHANLLYDENGLPK
jgi:hypothetical protein